MTLHAPLRRPPDHPADADASRRPFLSVVVATRNDDHGGNPLFRTQAFINCLYQQCVRFRLPAELIVVEWNPPDDRPRLAEVLEWPDESPYFSVRIIEVSNLLHRRLRYADRLPLFQMIAKNVGIRRARGRWILATNIDIIFSDELMGYLVGGHLDPGRFYRVDRYDVVGIADAFAPVEEQLARCQNSVIRINGRYGSLQLETGDFYRVWMRYAGLPWWAAVPAQISHSLARRAGRRLKAIPYAVRARAQLLRYVPWRYVLSDRWHRLRFGLRAREPRAGGSLRRLLRSETVRLAAWGLVRPWRWHRGARRVARWSRTALRLWWYATRSTGRAVASRVRRPFSSFRRNVALLREAVTWARALPALHTNACGDFTLLSREAWFSLRAYPELQMFSMFIDSLFVYMAYWAGYKEEFLPYPVFHIEHDHGFRPEPESVKALNDRIEQAGIPQIDDAGFRQYAIAMLEAGGPLEFNDDDWGFARDDCPETHPSRQLAAAVQGGSA